MEDDRHCDWRGRCKRKPYVDVFPFKKKPEAERELPCDTVEFVGGWSYLCYWHFQYERIIYNIKHLFGLTDLYLGYGYAETTEEYLKQLEEEANDE